MRPDGLTYVEEVAPSAIVAATWRGRTVPLHATSTGKVFLAFGGAALAAQERLERFTDTTVTDRDTLEEELALTRERGYAVCRGEYEMSAWGVSAPVFDRDRGLVAAVSIWGPGGRVTEERFDILGALVRTSASQLTRS
jgi:DNA-binding IclR family transcriptional regulator